MTPAGTSKTCPTSTPSLSWGLTMATYSTGARLIPTSIWGASLVLWVGVYSSSLGLRTLGSTRPWAGTGGSIAATGDGNYGAGRLSFHLWTDPTTHRQRPQHKGLGGALVAKVTTLRRAKT